MPRFSECIRTHEVHAMNMALSFFNSGSSHLRYHILTKRTGESAGHCVINSASQITALKP